MIIIKLLILWIIIFPVTMAHAVVIGIIHSIRELRRIWWEAAGHWRCAHRIHRELLNPGCTRREAVERMLNR